MPVSVDSTELGEIIGFGKRWLSVFPWYVSVLNSPFVCKIWNLKEVCKRQFIVEVAKLTYIVYFHLV